VYPWVKVPRTVHRPCRSVSSKQHRANAAGAKCEG
jgi:hypothetical protein